MKTLILLDIEQTITTDVFDGADFLPENIKWIKRLAATWGADFGLMSWAIHNWSDSERELFHDVQTVMETARNRFDKRFVISMEEWAKLLLKHDGLRVERSEITGIFRKEDIVFKLRKMWNALEFDHIILIDDTVEDGLTISLNSGKILRFLNPKDRVNVF